MLKRIVMQASGQMARLFTIVYTQLMICLLKLVKKLHVLIIQTYRNALTLLHPLAKTLPNFKVWVASQTTVAQSTKQEHSIAKAKVTPTGSQRQTIARPTRQRAVTAIKKTNVLVAPMKWVVSGINASKTALTLTVRQWIQAGLKLLETVRQRLQHVLHLQSLNKKLVELTKLVQSLFKKAVVALTLIINQLKAIGLKQAGIVRQPQQPAQRQRLKGH
jgi:hypothetical protein